MHYNLTVTSPPLEKWISTDYYYVVLGHYAGTTMFSTIEQVSGASLIDSHLNTLLPSTMTTTYSVWDISDNIAHVACNVTHRRIEQITAELTVLRVPNEIQVGQTFALNGSVYTRESDNVWTSEQVP